MLAVRFHRLAAAASGVAIIGLVAAPAAFAAPTFANRDLVAAASGNGLFTLADWNPYRHRILKHHRWHGGEGAVAAAALGIIGLAIVNASRPQSDCDYGGCYVPQTYDAPPVYDAPPTYVYDDNSYYAPPPPAAYVAPAPVYAPIYRGQPQWRAAPQGSAGRVVRPSHGAYAERYIVPPNIANPPNHR